MLSQKNDRRKVKQERKYKYEGVQWCWMGEKKIAKVPIALITQHRIINKWASSLKWMDNGKCSTFSFVFFFWGKPEKVVALLFDTKKNLLFAWGEN